MTSRQSLSDTLQLPSGWGCVLVFPAGLFGTLMLADYSGPPGWRGLAEFVGWWTVCVAFSVGCAALLARFRERRAGRYWFLVASILLGSGLLGWTIYEIQPTTPGGLKLAYTSMLQYVGIGGAVAFVAIVAWMIVSSRGR